MASQGEGFVFYFGTSIFQTFLLALLFFNWKYIVFCMCKFFFYIAYVLYVLKTFVIVICLHDFFALVYILIHELKIL